HADRLEADVYKNLDVVVGDDRDRVAGVEDVPDTTGGGGTHGVSGRLDGEPWAHDLVGERRIRHGAQGLHLAIDRLQQTHDHGVGRGKRLHAVGRGRRGRDVATRGSDAAGHDLLHRVL